MPNREIKDNSAKRYNGWNVQPLCNRTALREPDGTRQGGCRERLNDCA